MSEMNWSDSKALSTEPGCGPSGSINKLSKCCLVRWRRRKRGRRRGRLWGRQECQD